MRMFVLTLLMLYLATAREYKFVSIEEWTQWVLQRGDIGTNSFTWLNVNEYCMDVHNQTLASWSSEEEFYKLVQLAKGRLTYIGLRTLNLDWHVISNWTFVDGSNCTMPSTYVHKTYGNHLCINQWKINQPDNSYERERCGEIWNGQINDIICSMNYMGHEGFICNAPSITANDPSKVEPINIWIYAMPMLFAIFAGLIIFFFCRLELKQVVEVQDSDESTTQVSTSRSSGTSLPSYPHSHRDSQSFDKDD